MPIKFNKKLRWPLAILLIGIAIFALLMITRPQPEAQDQAEKVWLVDTQVIEISSYTPTITLYGTVESPRYTSLKASIDADVLATPVLEGQEFQDGDVLIQLDKEEVQLIVDEKKAEVAVLKAQIDTENNRYQSDLASLEQEKRIAELSERNLNRQRTLESSLASSKLELDQAEQQLRQQLLSVTQRQQSINDHKNRLALLEAQLLKAKAQQRQAILDQEDATVTAPYTGRLAKLMVAVGDSVRIGTELAQIYDDSALEIRAQIPARYLPLMQQAISNNTQITARASIDQQQVGLILNRISAFVEMGRSGVDGLFRAVQNQAALTIGRTVTITINLPQQEKVIRVPNDAIYELNAIYKINNGRIQKIQIEVLGSDKDTDGRQWVLIRSDELKDGDQIISTHLPNARSGLKIKVANP